MRPLLTPVRDQGTTSTCSAQTAACMKEWQERVDAGFARQMSPQFVYNRRANAPGDGMTGRDTMAILRGAGICPESAFPFGAAGLGDDAAVASAARYSIAEYARVHTVGGLKEALFRSGPCWVAFPVYSDDEKFYIPKSEQPSKGGHAVAVVGYTAAGFILRNSWGTGWADGGYGIYRYEDFGAHWEIWTAVDRVGTPPDIAPPLPPPARGDCIGDCLRAILGRARA